MTDQSAALPKVNVLGVNVNAITLDLATTEVSRWIDAGEKQYALFSPVSTIMQCRQDPALRQVANRAGLVNPDGMPVVFVCRMMGHKQADRVYGPDFMLAFTALSVERQYRHFYYGGAEGVPEALADIMRQRFPGVQIVGTYSPPFRPLTEAEDAEIVQRINDSQADVVWVGLGSPKQDHWMADHRARLNAAALLGVGAAFDFHTGRKPQAPRWMQRSGLEWTFRLATEPRRLWKRYLVNNPAFVLGVTAQMLGLRRYSVD